MSDLDATHDPARRSWIESANEPETEFPLQNLPVGVVTHGASPAPVIAAPIGDQALDLAAAAEAGLLNRLDPAVLDACRAPALNPLMSLGPGAWRAVRAALSDLLGADREGPRPGAAMLPRLSEVRPVLPAAIGDYTDFYASVHHATNVGSLFRPENPLLPNYKWIPIGYHGRASSVVISGTPVRRPSGQVAGPEKGAPVFRRTERLDYECEIGFFVGGANALGEPVPIAEAGDRIFGFCLVNDWSARDIQPWEYQPLGPFLSKSFATSVSPWVVTTEALAPFRAPLEPRAAGDPDPLPYLDDPRDAGRGGVDITVEVSLQSARMRDQGQPPVRLSRAAFLSMYWTPAQMLTHHASNGCNLRPGDLLASGTVSGPSEGSQGCLLELTRRGERPLSLPSGEARRFLEDGDEVILKGWCRREGYVSIGFGECRGRVIS